MNVVNDQIDDGKSWPPDGYTGQWTLRWPGGQLKYLATYRNGETNGEVTCYWENGQIAQSGISENGECRGIWSDYFEDGTKFKETEYRDNGNFTVRFLGPNGEVTETEVWEDGDLVREEGDELLADDLD